MRGMHSEPLTSSSIGQQQEQLSIQPECCQSLHHDRALSLRASLRTVSSTRVEWVAFTIRLCACLSDLDGIVCNRDRSQSSLLNAPLMSLALLQSEVRFLSGNGNRRVWASSLVLSDLDAIRVGIIRCTFDLAIITQSFNPFTESVLLSHDAETSLSVLIYQGGLCACLFQTRSTELDSLRLWAARATVIRSCPSGVYFASEERWHDGNQRMVLMK